MKKKPFKEVVLKSGPFKGKTAIFETAGTVRTVICSKCGFRIDVTFFIENPIPNDIGTECPNCGVKKWRWEGDN